MNLPHVLWRLRVGSGGKGREKGEMVGWKRGGRYRERKRVRLMVRYGIYERRVRVLQVYVINMLYINYNKRLKF